jgi:hypothetical protein
MKEIRGKIEGDLVLVEDTNLYGMVVGSVTVPKNIMLRLYGMLAGDLTLEKPSTVYVYGMVNGNIINNGAHLEVFGMVNGGIYRNDGETLVDPNAVVRDGIIK